MKVVTMGILPVLKYMTFMTSQLVHNKLIYLS
jgi:hypothetical protein